MTAKRTKPGAKPTILVAEDDRYIAWGLGALLEDEGFTVLQAQSGSQVLRAVENAPDRIDLILLDIMMPSGSKLRLSDTHAGYETGYAVAREIKKKYPWIRLLALSARQSPEIVSWFERHGAGYLCKPVRREDIVRAVRDALRKGRHRRQPRCFIVHGQDGDAVDQLKTYLRDDLQFSKVTVLREQPSLGKTIIEKFEEEAQKVDVAFVLLTPDDMRAAVVGPDDTKRRARQNVIFELGYFFAKLQRRMGNVILLYKGPLEVPSDLSGVVYIDISNGIVEADRQIRRELVGWL